MMRGPSATVHQRTRRPPARHSRRSLPTRRAPAAARRRAQASRPAHHRLRPANLGARRLTRAQVRGVPLAPRPARRHQENRRRRVATRRACPGACARRRVKTTEALKARQKELLALQSARSPVPPNPFASGGDRRRHRRTGREPSPRSRTDRHRRRPGTMVAAAERVLRNFGCGFWYRKPIRTSSAGISPSTTCAPS